MSKDNKTKSIPLSFSALNPYVQDWKTELVEKEITGQNFIYYGNDNHFPDYLLDLYRNVATLKTIIDTYKCYICGNKIISNVIQLSNDDMEDLVESMTLSYLIYGGFALNIVKNKLGQVAVVKCLDFRNVRSDKKGQVLYYSEDFSEKKSAYRSCWSNYYAYPAYTVETADIIDIFTSILYVKNERFSTYPHPIYEAALTACEMERSIDEYQINSINNGFMGSVLVSLNNGVPDDEMKEEIEQNFNEKFTGKENAGRVIISYNNDKDHAAEVIKIDTEDFSERYKTLAERTRETIFTTFRITPKLIGISEDNIGFNSQEYRDAYVLFYNTAIKPIQNMIVKTINKIFKEDAVIIEPFEIQFTEGTIKNEKVN